jgi:pyruvate kinase
LVRRLNNKRTKIVATIGPASWNEDTLRKFIQLGMDVARINFSHGDHETHSRSIDLVRRIAEEEGQVVAIMADIQGPKIRIGKVANEPLIMKKGDKLTLTLDDVPGENGLISLPHPEFLQDIKVGTPLLLDDGKVEFVVREATSRMLVCENLFDGVLSSRKGVTAPKAKLTLSAITDKDREDIKFALSKKTDYIAMSFVRSVEDIREMRWLIRHLSGENVAIIAKIEKHEALVNIESIIEAADGVMVARGDLGIETPAEEVPYHQKRIINLCNVASKPVITATQMLNSMVDNPRPTRAEASDVYNAIVDGTDAVMLSNESASGHFPVESVETMARIAVIAEQHMWDNRPQSPVSRSNDKGQEGVSDAIAQATFDISQALSPKAIITSTITGYTARRVARERPKTPILCVTPNEITFRRMALVWGVIPLMTPQFNTIDEMIKVVVQAAREQELVKQDDLIVIIAGVPFGVGGQTNFMKIHRVGEASELD